MKADAKTEAGVKDAIAGLQRSYEGRDAAGFMACFAPDDDVVLFGTGADEKRIGPAAIEAQAARDWAQTESIALRLDDIAVSAAGDVAWAAADGAFEIRAGGAEMALPARTTFVLESRDGKWLIVQAHCSTPFTGQAEGQSVPA